MKLDVKRIRRFGRRQAVLFRLLRNWREVTIALQTGAPVERLALRSGIELRGPAEAHLDFLFTEIWIDRVYTPSGYEIRDGDIVIDVGASIGVFAAFAALAARDVEVFAYEPFPGSAERLKENTARITQSRVHVFQKAVAASSGERVLVANPANWIVHAVSQPGARAPGLPVVAVSLDDMFATHGIAHCDLLKLDCEGSEYEILDAASPATLGRIAKIVGEFHPLPAGTEGASAESWLRATLARKGFAVDEVYPFPGRTESGVFHACRIGDRAQPTDDRARD